MPSNRVKLVGGGSITLPKNNLEGTSAPGSSNDKTEGYEPNSLWFDTSQSPVEVYRCVDATENNAIWVYTSLEESELDIWLDSKSTDDLSEGSSNLYFSSTNVDNLTQDTEPDSANDYLMTYDSSAGGLKKILMDVLAGGGSGLPLLHPGDFSLDGNNTGSSRGNAFNIAETIDFASGSDGSVWITFHFPSTLDDTKDINLSIVYNLSGTDDSKIVTIQTEYWSYGSGTTPSDSSPTGTNSDDISTGTAQDQREIYELTNIPSGDLTTGNTITLRITRFGSSDTYSGTFQMLYIFPYQS